MTKYFTIALAGATPEQETKLAELWRGRGWWHGITNFWLMKDISGTRNAASIRDEIRAVAPTARVLVVECAPQTWAGSSMTESNRDWLKNYWPPEGR
jgi:hypothetical protein